MARSPQGIVLLVALALLALAGGLFFSGVFHASGDSDGLTVIAAEDRGAVPVDAPWHPEPNGVAAVDAPARRSAPPEPAAGPSRELDLRISLDTLTRLSAPVTDSQGEPQDPHEPPGTDGAVIDLFRDSVPARSGTVQIVAGPSAGAVFAADAAGRVFLKALRPGRHQVLVMVEDKAPFLRFLRIQPGQRASCSFVWRPGGALEGRVTDPSGRPITRARVVVDGNEAQTDEQGRYQLQGLISGDDAVVRVSAPGCVPCERPVDLHRGITTQFSFQLQPAASMRGRVVLRARGDPLRTPRVFVLPAAGNASAEERSIPFHLPEFAGLATEPDGTFLLEGLPLGTPIRVIARHELFPASKPETLRLREPGLQRRTLILDPIPTAAVRGTVRDAQGRPVAGARVSCWPEPPRGRDAEPVDGDVFRDAMAELQLSTETLLAHVIPAELLRLRSTETVTDQDGNFVLGRARLRRPSLLVVAQRGYLSAQVSLGARDLGPQDVALQPDHSAPPGASAVAHGVVLQFTGASARPTMLRVSVKRDGVQDSLSFRWNPREPLTLPLLGAAQVALTATFHRGSQELATLARQELVVQGLVPVTVPLP